MTASNPGCASALSIPLKIMASSSSAPTAIGSSQHTLLPDTSNTTSPDHSNYSNEKRTCVTTLPHNFSKITDHRAHFFGCIEYGEWETFFDDQRIWAHFDDKETMKKKYEVAVQITTQLKRNTILRNAIKQEKPQPNLPNIKNKKNDSAKHSSKRLSRSKDKMPLENDKPRHMNDQRTSLVENVELSHSQWKASVEYKDGIGKVREWRKSKTEEPKEAMATTATNTIASNRGRNHRGEGDSSSSDAENAKNLELQKLVAIIKNYLKDGNNGQPEKDTIPPMSGGQATSPGEQQQQQQQQQQKEKKENQKPLQLPRNDERTPPIPSEERQHNELQTVEEYELEKDVNAYIIQYELKLGDQNQLPSLVKSSIAKDVNKNIKGVFPNQRISFKHLLEDEKILGRKHREPDGVIRYIHIPANNMHWVERLVEAYYGQKLSPEAQLETPANSEADLLLRPQFWYGQQHSGGNNIVHARHLRPICERISTNKTTAENNPKNIVLFMPYMHWETDRKRETIARMIDDKLMRNQKKLEEQKQEEFRRRCGERNGLDRKLNSEPIVVPPPPPDRKNTLPQLIIERMGLSGFHPSHTLENATLGVIGKKRTTVVHVNKYGRMFVHHPLGQFLLDAACLYESMSNYRDKQMIDQFLFHKLPLHLRRTLDQAHFWTLKSTRRRDRDQVVYRGTNIDLTKRHVLKANGKDKFSWSCYEDRPQDTAGVSDNNSKGRWKQPWSAFHSGRRASTADKPQAADAANAAVAGAANGPPNQENSKQITNGLEGNGAPGHEAPGPDNGEVVGQKQQQATADGGNGGKAVAGVDQVDKSCEKCREDIRKISRVVMVDQLWMWILDEHTIITCFPRRYGTNKSDGSGIHKSIRLRLNAARDNQFRSVFDLGLVIIDECSNTFFDRTKTDENLPQVIDIFAEAIGNVTSRQTTFFEHVWHWTEKASQVYRSKSRTATMTDIDVPLLDINPEGLLQREIKDIIEELDIMLEIKRKQLDMTKRYKRNVQYILDPNGFTMAGSSGALQDTELDATSTMSILLFLLRRSESIGGSSSMVRGGSGDMATMSPSSDAGKHTDHLSDADKHRHTLDWFQIQAAEVLSDIGDRISELQRLKSSAQSAAQSINDLLELKQQQASVVQAWQSVQQAQETVRQGQAIMGFTVVTIMFLPPSFISSVFGMNNEYVDKWRLKEQFELMLPISAGFVGIVILLVFSDLLRAILWCSWKVVLTYVLVKVKIYSWWLGHNEDIGSQNMIQKTEQRIENLRIGVRKARQKNLREAFIEKREQGETHDEVPRGEV